MREANLRRKAEKRAAMKREAAAEFEVERREVLRRCRIAVDPEGIYSPDMDILVVIERVRLQNLAVDKLRRRCIWQEFQNMAHAKALKAAEARADSESARAEALEKDLDDIRNDPSILSEELKVKLKEQERANEKQANTIAELQKSLEDATHAKGLAESSNEEAGEELGRVKCDLDAARKAQNEAEDATNKAKAENDTSNGLSASLRAEMTETERKAALKQHQWEADAAKAAELTTSLRKDLADSEKQLNLQKQQREAAAATESALRGDIDNLNVQVQAAQQRAEREIKAAADASQVAMAEKVAEITALQTKIKAGAAEAKKSQATETSSDESHKLVEEVNHWRNEAQRHYDEAQNIMTQGRNAVQERDDNIHQLTDALTTAQGQAQQQQTGIDNLSNSLVQEQNRVQLLQQNNSELAQANTVKSTEITDLQSQLAAEQRETAKNKDILNGMQARIRSDGINLRQARETVERQRGELVEANDQLFRLGSEVGNLNNTVTAKEGELALARKAYTASEVGMLYRDLTRAHQLLDEVAEKGASAGYQALLNDVMGANRTLSAVFHEIRAVVDNDMLHHEKICNELGGAVIKEEIIEAVDPEYTPVIVQQAQKVNIRLGLLRRIIQFTPRNALKNRLLGNMTLPRGDEDRGDDGDDDDDDDDDAPAPGAAGSKRRSEDTPNSSKKRKENSASTANSQGNSADSQHVEESQPNAPFPAQDGQTGNAPPTAPQNPLPIQFGAPNSTPAGFDFQPRPMHKAKSQARKRHALSSTDCDGDLDYPPPDARDNAALPYFNQPLAS